VLGDPVNFVNPLGMEGFAPFDPKFDLRFCPIAAAMATDSAKCREIVDRSMWDGTYSKRCKTGSVSACQRACVLSDFCDNLNKYCQPRRKKPKANK
jgi:hypothetical protein